MRRSCQWRRSRRLSSRRGGGARAVAPIGRRRVSKERVYEFRGRIACSICQRRMEGAARHRETIYYRCNARTRVPESATASAHPAQVHLRGDLVSTAMNRWIGQLFDPLHRRGTIDALLEPMTALQGMQNTLRS
jgi:hypothetical protein